MFESESEPASWTVREDIDVGYVHTAVQVRATARLSSLDPAECEAELHTDPCPDSPKISALALPPVPVDNGAIDHTKTGHSHPAFEDSK